MNNPTKEILGYIIVRQCTKGEYIGNIQYLKSVTLNFCYPDDSKIDTETIYWETEPNLDKCLKDINICKNVCHLLKETETPIYNKYGEEYSYGYIKVVRETYGTNPTLITK